MESSDWLRKVVFLKCYLGVLGEVVDNAILGLGLPRISDLRRHVNEDTVVPRELFFSRFRRMSVDNHW